MQSPVERFVETADAVHRLGTTLYLHHSRLKWIQLNPPGSSVFMLTGEGDWVWSPTDDGEPIWRSVIDQLHSLTKLAATFADHTDAESEIFTSLKCCHELLVPGFRHHDPELLKAAEVFGQFVSKACDSARSLPDKRAGSILLIADTNALIRNPDIEKWNFGDVKKFTLVLTSTVMSELDVLKNRSGGAGSVGETADKLIRRIKGYRDRGRLVDGVTVVRDKIDVFAYAVEPDFSRALPWLDPLRNDDRLLAGVIELIRLHPHCSCTLVTGDISFQTKAELAMVDFIEPPAAR